jgi:geranylgeranyl pyrophosphate synthase
MLINVYKGIEEDLRQVQQMVDNEMNIKAGYIGTFAHLECSTVNQTVRPALVILSSRLFGGDPVKTVALASIFQFIYLASNIHEGIGENDSDYIRGDSDPRDGSQFPVLVGDFLYGKFFKALCDADLIDLLHPLAEIICCIHEGGILKKKALGQPLSSHAVREAVLKETAELFSGCCRVGARLAGAPQGEQELLGKFGLNLGLAFGLLELGAAFEYIDGFFQSALSNLPPLRSDDKEREAMVRLLRNLREHGLPACQMVG